MLHDITLCTTFQRSHYLPFGHLPFGNYFSSVFAVTLYIFCIERLTYKTSGNPLVWITARLNYVLLHKNEIFREPYRVCKLSENNHALWHNTMNIYYISFNGIDNCHLPTKSYIAHQLTIFDGQLNINAG